jgi:thioester reductase-like protein
MTRVLDTVDHWVDRHPEKLLYSFLDVHGAEVESHSYESFRRRVELIAGHLRARRALQTGDRVLLVYPPGLEMICALFACERAGFIPVPTAPPTAYGFTAALYRLAHIARDCQAATMLTSRESFDALQRACGGDANDAVRAEARAALAFEWIISEDLVEPADRPCNGHRADTFFLQYTSGSTGSPRGVVVTQENVLHNCRLVVDHESPVAVSWLPQHHDMGLLGYYIYIALSGGTTYGFSPTSFIQRPALWLETITKHSATGSSAPNFAFEYCLRPGRLSDTTLSTLDLASLRFLMAAAEPIRPDTYRRFLQKFERHGLRSESFFVAYGLAENTLAVTNYGRQVVSVNKKKLSEGVAATTRHVADIGLATHLMSCGRPLGDNRVRIVQPETRVALGEGAIGEVWVEGSSKCIGYWNQPELSRDAFHAVIDGDDSGAEYLRTGDMGFFHDGELYVCGRRKDMIIVRGENFYPQDIEAVVEKTSPLLRAGCVAAFDVEDGARTTVVIVAEVANPKARPDAQAIVAAVRDWLGLEVGMVAFVAAKSIPKTSSGKIMRFKTKQLWLTGRLSVLHRFARESIDDQDGELAADDNSPIGFLKARYALTGTETYSLIDAGVDSIDLVIFVHELKERLESRGADLLADQVDFRLIQQVSVADLFQLITQFESAPAVAVEQFRDMVKGIRERHLERERAMMVRDRSLAFEPVMPPVVEYPEQSRVALLTGATGFLGPFLLASLLTHTDGEIRVLARGTSEAEARHRIRGAFDAVGASPETLEQLERRVVPVLGDLEKPNLGLHDREWAALAREVDTVYHNAATVNYLYDYATMRSANVGGTNEVVRLAFDARLKPLNYVSTTFIFGWATKDVLYETDTNDNMELLDFGYSQTKWAAEQAVFDARRRGLGVRVFRPALITPSVAGGGNNFDITLRLLAFMVKHGVGVDALNQVSFMPAEVTANNIVAIATQRDTLGGTFHVTRDEYTNMAEILRIIQARTGRQFHLFSLKEFVPEVIRRCTREDLLYPLLDFLIGSVDNISSMEFKRYDSSRYQAARNATPRGMPDPSLDDTVAGILHFMNRTGII